MTSQSFGLGLVGVGNFGQFCLNAYRKLPNLNLVAVYDKDSDLTQKTAVKFSLEPYSHFEDLLADPAVDIVAINTPPSSHVALSMAALHAGKHVFCEKPLATSLADAEAVLRLAGETGVILTVNYIMRANPLYRLVKQLSELKVGDKSAFGNLRRCSLENFAADENLGHDHWFWDQSISGGIFVEHGVHFFDLFAWQLGRLPIKVVALAEAREDGCMDTVQAIVSYEGGATSSSFHSFTHANAGELQSIVFGWDWAVAELHGWIALDLRLEALLDMEGVELLEEILAPREKLLEITGEPLLPGASLSWQIVERFPGNTMMKGHGEERRIEARVVLEASLGGPEVKLEVYEQSVRAGLAALIAAIENGRSWVIPPDDLWASTAVAIAAREAAASGQTITSLDSSFSEK
jgi:predicted dehydrogenase